MKRRMLALLGVSLLVAVAPILAQGPGPAAGSGEPEGVAPSAPYNNGPDMQEGPQNAPQAQETPVPTAPPSTGWRKFGAPAPMAPLPSKLTVPAGTWITIHVDQPLSSDHNQPGDFFAASLAQPIVVDGIVVARRGQMVGGAVAEAARAGRAKGVSRLRLELTEVNLVDGRQVPVKTQLIERRGETSTGRDAAAIGTTTGIGAAIGAAADGGFGAGMGAIAGAAASTIGVLVTRGRPTVVYPETPLTFRLEAPVIISTTSAPDAFQPVQQSDYGQRMQYRAARTGTPPPYYYYSPYSYSPYWYSPWYGPYGYGWGGPWFGPSVVFYGRFGGHGGWHGGGHHH